MATIKLATTRVDVKPCVLDSDDESCAVASISFTRMPAWLYASEAKAFGRHLIAIAEKLELRAKKRTQTLRARRKRR